MKRRVLVIGGTRFFGKHLVTGLLARGDEVTLLTRGQAPDSFGARVGQLVADRDDARALARAVGDSRWDIVYDQICYAPAQAEQACEIFAGRVGRYVHTSTQSVYLTDGVQREVDFDPLTHAVTGGGRDAFPFPGGYGEGKRQAEAVFFQRSPFPVAALRIPIVLGLDDYTGRLEFHLKRVRDGLPIACASPASETSFISSEEAGRFLVWLGEREETGPVNACATGSVSLNRVLGWMGEACGRAPVVREKGSDDEWSSFVGDRTRCLDASLASSRGFRFSRLEDWLPGLIRERLKTL